MEDSALEVRHVTKEYQLYDSELSRLKEAFHPMHKIYHKKFYALDDVNFSIKKGEKVGIIGANGAGKSTLLKIITGVLNPTKGEVIAEGKIAALLELGAGFNPNYTGIENIRLNGTLMGFSPEEINQKMQQIIDFADIGEFIYQPVKSYSSGMFVRLAFATQIFSEPDLLIVDEALSVGDIRFQQKCYRAMDSIMKNTTVLLVTHDTAAVTRFCHRVIWLNKGKMIYDGEVAEGLKQYQGFLIDLAIQEKEHIGKNDYDFVETEKKISKSRVSHAIPDVSPTIKPKGNGEAHIFQCGMYDAEDRLVTDNIEPESDIKFVVRVEFFCEVSKPILGLAIKDRLGNDVIAINSETLGVDLPPAKDKLEYVLTFKLPPLNKGEYTVTVAIAKGYQADHIQMCWLDDVLVFKIPERKHDVPGLIYMEKGEIDIYNYL